MQSIENKVLSRIYGNGRGWSFSRFDFSDLGGISAVDKSLSRLCASGKIRRVINGLYDYPRYSKLLRTDMPPDISKVAQALARKFGWSIQISGSSALSILGLSTQVPTSYVYLSNGGSKTYEIDNVTLIFKKARMKDSGFKNKDSDILVQALKEWGHQSLNDDQKEKICEFYSLKQRKRILKETLFVTSWVYERIKEIFETCNSE